MNSIKMHSLTVASVHNYLPPYLTFLNPIEECFSVVKFPVKISLTTMLFVSYMRRSAKILILNKEGIIEKISDERRAYESVDEKSLS